MIAGTIALEEPVAMKRRRWLLLPTLVLAVGGAGGAWVWKAQRQYAVNRQLIAALDRKDIGQALGLVNAGADPDTRYNPTPAPTLKSLMGQLLRHSPAPEEYSYTAFLLTDATACYASPVSWTANVQPLEDTPLICAMLAHGANIDQQDFEGDTLLMFAILRNDEELTRLLVEQGANVTLEDKKGYTPLYYAVYSGNKIPVLRLLLAHGADPTHLDTVGQTPLTAAQAAHRPDIVALLRGKR